MNRVIITKPYQTVLFLHAVRPDALTIYKRSKTRRSNYLQRVLVCSNRKDDVDTVIAKFDQHFIGQINETYDRYIFNKRDQEPGETIDSYITVLSKQVKSCNFNVCLHYSLLRDRIVRGERDNCRRKRPSQNSAQTFQQCVDICRSCKATDIALKMINFRATRTD